MGWGRLSRKYRFLIGTKEFFFAIGYHNFLALGGNADSLQELSVRVYPPGECKMSPTAEYFGTITDNMLCAGGELNKDACEVWRKMSLESIVIDIICFLFMISG